MHEELSEEKRIYIREDREYTSSLSLDLCFSFRMKIIKLHLPKTVTVMQYAFFFFLSMHNPHHPLIATSSLPYHITHIRSSFKFTAKVLLMNSSLLYITFYYQ